VRQVIGYTLLSNGLYRKVFKDLGPAPQQWRVGKQGVVIEGTPIEEQSKNYTGPSASRKTGSRIGERT